MVDGLGLGDDFVVELFERADRRPEGDHAGGRHRREGQEHDGQGQLETPSQRRPASGGFHPFRPLLPEKGVLQVFGVKPGRLQ